MHSQDLYVKHVLLSLYLTVVVLKVVAGTAVKLSCPPQGKYGRGDLPRQDSEFTDVIAWAWLSGGYWKLLFRFAAHGATTSLLVFHMCISKRSGAMRVE